MKVNIFIQGCNFHPHSQKLCTHRGFMSCNYLSLSRNNKNVQKLADTNRKIITKTLFVQIAYDEAFLNDSSIFEKYFDCSELIIYDLCRASKYIIQHPTLFHIPQVRSIMFIDRNRFEKIPASTDHLLAFICDQKSYSNRMKCRLHLENDGIRDFIDKFLKVNSKF